MSHAIDKIEDSSSRCPHGRYFSMCDECVKIVERRMMERVAWEETSRTEQIEAEQVIDDIAPADTDQVVLELTRIQRTCLRDTIGKRLYYRALKAIGFKKAIATLFKAHGDVQWENASGTYRLRKIDLTKPEAKYTIVDEAADQ